jgi:hypothetical protein
MAGVYSRGGSVVALDALAATLPRLDRAPSVCESSDASRTWKRRNR